MCDKREESTHDLHDLDLLAQCWPVLFGRSLDPSKVLGGQGSALSRSGRSDAIDDKSQELQAALRGLDRLMKMAACTARRSSAEVLLYARVACGFEVRHLGEVYLTLALAYSTKKPKPLTEERRKTLLRKGHRLYEKACSLYLGDSSR